VLQSATFPRVIALSSDLQQRVALYCIVLQCCSVLQSATFPRIIALSSGLQQRVAMYCIVWQCVAVLLCVATRCVSKGDSLM